MKDCGHRSAYECAFCSERRCMECDARVVSEEIKTAVRWCPKHRHAGMRGLLEGDVTCHGCGERVHGHEEMTSFRHKPSADEPWRDEVWHLRCEQRRSGNARPLVWLVRIPDE